MDEFVVMEKELDELRSQHQEIDGKINSMAESPFQDQLQMMRLKREKLQLKDAIYRLEEELYPDIIA